MKLLSRRLTRSKHALRVPLVDDERNDLTWARIRILYRLVAIEKTVRVDDWKVNEWGAYGDRTQTDALREAS